MVNLANEKPGAVIYEGPKRKINANREVSVHLSQPREGVHRVRLRHMPTGVEGHGDGSTPQEARGAADADFDEQLAAGGLER